MEQIPGCVQPAPSYVSIQWFDTWSRYPAKPDFAMAGSMPGKRESSLKETVTC
ncbi:MAG: hypothetical protein ACMUIA_06090 [bacterium]